MFWNTGVLSENLRGRISSPSKKKNRSLVQYSALDCAIVLGRDRKF